jgi:hypothetical protein
LKQIQVSRHKYQDNSQFYRFFLQLKMLINRENICSKRGEAVINNSFLTARRSSAAAGGTRCCGQGFFANFLFSKKVGEKGC